MKKVELQFDNSYPLHEVNEGTGKETVTRS